MSQITTFTTQEDYTIWPEWFVRKYAGLIAFNAARTGALHPICAGKMYLQWDHLHTDIQQAIDWNANPLFKEFALVFLHEGGGITRCQISRDAIKWTEPTGWEITTGVTYNILHGLSDVTC